MKSALTLACLNPFSEVECPHCHTRHAVPVLLGHFLLLGVLGQGGMGVVYKALDQTLGRFIAIKVMRREIGDDSQFIASFLREARAAASLNHHNVVQIYSCSEEHGQPYIVMELVGGSRLDDLMATGKPLDEKRVLEIGLDIAHGLQAAHGINLVHGDIKPANILLDQDGVAKVVDFGLARFIAAQQADHEVWGTPYYIAPELVKRRPYDFRADMYSLGATLFHALAARPPFDGKTANDAIFARLKHPAPDLLSLVPNLNPQTAEVISRLLEVDPSKRYPTYPSLIADLRESARAMSPRFVQKEVYHPQRANTLSFFSPHLFVHHLWSVYTRRHISKNASTTKSGKTTRAASYTTG